MPAHRGACNAEAGQSGPKRRVSFIANAASAINARPMPVLDYGAGVSAVESAGATASSELCPDPIC